MHIVQRDLGPIPETFVAKYVDSGKGAIAVGAAVCYDHTIAAAHAAGTWAEEELFKVVNKPVTANLLFFAGIVLEIIKRTGTGSNYSSFVRIQKLNQGSVVRASVKANSTIAVTPLKISDDSWDLVVDGDATIAVNHTVHTVGYAGETANTSSTAAVKPVFGIL